MSLNPYESPQHDPGYVGAVQREQWSLWKKLCVGGIVLFACCELANRAFDFVVPDPDNAGDWSGTAYGVLHALMLIWLAAIVAAIVGGIGLLVARFPPS